MTEKNTEQKASTGREASELSGLVSFHPVTEPPPRPDEEYLVMMFKQGVQDKAFTVALWQDSMWWSDALPSIGLVIN